MGCPHARCQLPKIYARSSMLHIILDYECPHTRYRSIHADVLCHSFICKHDCERSRTCVRRKVRSMVMMMMRTTLVFVDRICFDDMQRSTAIGILLQGINLTTAIRKNEKIKRERIWNNS